MSRNTSIGLLVLLLLGLAAIAQAGTSQAPAAPATGTPSASAPASTARSHAASYGHAGVPKLDLNTATREDLMKLPGVGEATADKIIAARPFKSRDELLAKNIMTRKEYQAISGRVVARSGSPVAGGKEHK